MKKKNNLPVYDFGSWLGENAMPLLQTAGGAALVATGVGIPAGVGMMAGGVGQMANNALTPDQQMQPQQLPTTIANRQYAPTFAEGGPVKNKQVGPISPNQYPPYEPPWAIGNTHFDGQIVGSKRVGNIELGKNLKVKMPQGMKSFNRIMPMLDVGVEIGNLLFQKPGDYEHNIQYSYENDNLPNIPVSDYLNAKFGGIYKNGGYMNQYANGGPMPQVYEGQNHLGPNGGIPIDGNGNPSVVSKNRPIALVENNEVSWMSPQGTPYIFSDKLGFAKQAKSIMNKYKMRLGENFDKTDSIATTGLNGELANLMNKQEVYKQENGYHTMPDGSTMSDKEMGSYCMGGKVKYGCGGKLPKYALGGPPASIFYMPNDAPIELSEEQDLDLGDASNTQLADFNPDNYRGTAPKVLNTYEPYYGIQQTLGRNSNIEKMAPIVPSVSGASLPQTPVVPSDFTNTVAGNLNPTKTNSPFDMSTMDYLGYGLQALSPLANMAMTLANKPKEIKPSYVAPETINLESQRDALRRDATTAANVNRRNARGGSFYNYYSNALAGTNAAQRGLGEGLSQSYLNEAGTNLQSRERAKLTNLEQDRYFENLNSQEQGAYLSNLAGSVSQVGQFGAGFMRDRNQMKSTKMAADAMGTTQYNYDTDPSDGQYKQYVIYKGKKTFIQ